MLNVAIIGASGGVQRYAQHLQSMTAVKVAGVYDARLAAASELAALYGCPAYASYEALDAAMPVNTVFICNGLPADSRKPLVLVALAGGRHVIVPLSEAFVEADAAMMPELVRAHAGRLLFSRPERFYYHNKDLKKRIEAGAIGNIGMINVKRYAPFPPLEHGRDASGPEGDLREDAQKCGTSGNEGGALFRLALHDMDLLRWIVGEVDSVYAMRTATEQLDYVLVTLKFCNGAIANLEAYLGYPGEPVSAVEFAGSRGVIRYDSSKTNALNVYKASGAEPQPVKAGFSPSFRNPEYDELVHLISCLQEDSNPVLTAEDACQTMNVVSAALKSLRTGLPVELAAVIRTGVLSREACGGGEHA